MNKFNRFFLKNINDILTKKQVSWFREQVKYLNNEINKKTSNQLNYYYYRSVRESCKDLEIQNKNILLEYLEHIEKLEHDIEIINYTIKFIHNNINDAKIIRILYDHLDFESIKQILLKNKDKNAIINFIKVIHEKWRYNG